MINASTSSWSILDVSQIVETSVILIIKDFVGQSTCSCDQKET